MLNAILDLYQMFRGMPGVFQLLALATIFAAGWGIWMTRRY